MHARRVVATRATVRDEGSMTTTPSQPAIRATGLRKSFADQVVLDGIDLHVAEGTIFALLGPNGAGKTTTVHILSTLIGADGGQVHVGGHDVARDPDAVREVIGVTGQLTAVDNLLTGQENLLLMADLHHLDRAEGRRRGRASARSRWCRSAISSRFSWPVSRLSTAVSWPVTPITSRTASGSRATSWPPTWTWPPSAPIRVDRMCTVVVLPAPLGPSSAKIVPSATCRSMPSSTTWSANDLRSPVALIAGWDGVVVILPSSLTVALVATTRRACMAPGSPRFQGGFRADPPTSGANRPSICQPLVCLGLSDPP